MKNLFLFTMALMASTGAFASAGDSDVKICSQIRETAIINCQDVDEECLAEEVYRMVEEYNYETADLRPPGDEGLVCDVTEESPRTSLERNRRR